MTDQSRVKSIIFLLSREARNFESLSSDLDMRAVIKTMQVLEDESGCWSVSLEVGGLKRVTLINKDRFVLYPVKSEERYPTDPVLVNSNTAREVIKQLLPELTQSNGYKYRAPGTYTLIQLMSLGILLTPPLFTSNYRLFDSFMLSTIFILMIVAYFLGLRLRIKPWFLISQFIAIALFYSAQPSFQAVIPVLIVYFAVLSWLNQNFHRNNFVRETTWLFPFLFWMIFLFSSLTSDDFKLSGFSIGFFLLPSILIFCGQTVLSRKFGMEKAFFLIGFLLYIIFVVLSLIDNPTKILALPLFVTMTYFQFAFGGMLSGVRILIPSVLLIG
jgi:hypothetical protein